MSETNTESENRIVRQDKPVVMGARGALHVPDKFRNQLGLHAGMMFIVSIEDGRVVFTPATLTPTVPVTPAQTPANEPTEEA